MMTDGSTLCVKGGSKVALDGYWTQVWGPRPHITYLILGVT